MLRTYLIVGAVADQHVPEHPERTAKRNAGRSSDMNFDVVFRVWPSRGAMLRTIQMQKQREPQFQDWRAVQP